MSKELERRFLVVNDNWREAVVKMENIRDGFIFINAIKTVRVRDCGEMATLTVKIKDGAGSRYEYEYEIPKEDAEEMLTLHCSSNRINKRRYYVAFSDYLWVVDVFEGAFAGLIMAEIEYDENNKNVPLPDWIGSEVTADETYDKYNLLRRLQ
jgi:adenylate cyclase